MAADGGRHVDLLDRAEQGKAFGHHRSALSRRAGTGPAADRRGRRHRGHQRRGLSWLNYDALAAERTDVIHVQLLGRGDGSTGVDYTVNAGIGYPLVTGPANHAGPINHVLPAWDVCCGLYAALAVVAAVRRRDQTGEGTRISLALEDVALATAGNLGLLTEPQVIGTQRQRLGNAIYGQYGQDFTSRDGVAFMVVLLTGRHFRDLVDVTGTGAAVAALAEALGADFSYRG